MLLKGVGLWILVMLTAGLVEAKQQQPPNFLFLLADDLGYNEVSWNNRWSQLYSALLEKLKVMKLLLKLYVTKFSTISLF